MTNLSPVRLRPFPPGAIAAIERGNLAIAAELTGVTFGELWGGEAKWAGDYLAYLQRYEPQAGLFLVVHGSEAIGRVGWTQFTPASPHELSYVILLPWRGQRMAVAATKQLIKLLRLTRLVTTLTAVVKTDNAASRRVVEQIGFRLAKADADQEFYELRLGS